MKVKILGTSYKIIKKKYKEDKSFKKRGIDGYTDSILHKIVYCDMSTYPGYKNESKKYIRKCENEVMRHEIIHAFLYQSGLGECAMESNGSWASNEEMVDWITLQFPKILNVYKECKCL